MFKTNTIIKIYKNLLTKSGPETLFSKIEIFKLENKKTEYEIKIISRKFRFLKLRSDKTKSRFKIENKFCYVVSNNRLKANYFKSTAGPIIRPRFKWAD